jgi:hypothetical protein
MKTTKELLKLTLKEGEKGIRTGLCAVIMDMYEDLIITSQEFDILTNFIHRSRPASNDPLYRKTQKKSAYYWKPGSWTPRKKWLKYHINMRTTEQLLKLILKQGNLNFEKGNPYNSLYINGYKGLCGFVGDLRDQDIITGQEYDILMRFFTYKRPQEDSKHYYRDIHSLYDHQPYYWERRKWNPRKAWLEDQIKSIK